ncbi:MAG: decaprenyl-phosphate phosphoribosyltransferase [Bacteroidota bacterium]
MSGTFFQLIRVHNWIKNGFVFLPLIFSQHLTEPDYFKRAVLAVFSFCLTSSAVYIINDLVDQQSDRLHPIKNLRPIAAGKVSVTLALIIGFICLTSGIGLSIYLSYSMLYLLVGYLVLNAGYSFYLKRISIIDCICVAMGFVLRILAGCAAINVIPSDWILTITFFLALYLAFSKRKSELLLLNEHSETHRKSLAGYSIKLLDTYILICAVISLTAYLLYSFDFRVVTDFNTHNLKYSVVFVVIGFFRYFQLVEHPESSHGGDPTTLALKDRPLQLAVLLWLAYIIWVIYG